ncbi:MAG: methionine synthase [Archaeoglobales archaeon]|nr:MAG: methionine synthase [Archaeoglobales archaeon]
MKTTVVGSYPKPKWLLRIVKMYKDGEVDEEFLEEAYRDSVKSVVKDHEIAGVDIIWDGEMRREEMTSYFAERIEGFEIYGEVRVWGNAYYPKPSIVGELRYRDELALKDFLYLKGITDREIKVPITGAYTIVDWSFNEYYKTKEDAVYSLAEVLNREFRELVKVGAKYIQIDEPAIPTHPDEIEIAKNAVEIMVKGVNAYVGIHMCYGNYRAIFPDVLDFKVDQIDFEFANRKFEDLKILKEYDYDKDLGFGCIDVHSRRIESVDEVKNAIRMALEIVDPDRLYVDPDCGMKLLPRDVAFEKLKVMVKAVEELKEELDI